jgi:EAL domain-containing protein (putative c-di-GMP-specific phosphodiesterase class I)
MARDTSSAAGKAGDKETARPAVRGVPLEARRRSNRFPDTPFRDPSSEDGSRKSFHAINSLIAPEDLSVVFQPIVRLDPHRIFAYEALVRCRLPELKNPTVLFERAVEVGCTGRLGRMIREVAMPLCGDFPVFVNVHPVELQEPWLIRPDDPMFLHHRDVYVEITEAVPFTHFELCHNVLRELRSRAHMHLVVDDLGAGYSNLKSIADLEPKVVKIDRGIVEGLKKGSRQQKLVRAIVRLCEDLGAEVVAEGIETAEELGAVREAGVHLVQGYLFARPAFPLPEIDPAARRL